MSFTSDDLPAIECPKCGHVDRSDPNWCLDIGDEFTCPTCGAVLECHDVEMTKHAYWTLKSPPEATPLGGTDR